MLTAEQKLDLKTVVTDYRDALLSGDNDRVADTAEVLDVVVSAMFGGFDDTDEPLYYAIVSTYDEERGFLEAASELDDVLAQLA